MFNESAEFYDLIYLAFKDYPAEAKQAAAMLRGHNPACRDILDVACGTGEHARLLAAAGFLVDGLDLEAGLTNIAQRKNPGGRFFIADMSAFHLPHRYDAVLCLFSSIGYLKTLDRVEAALVCFREHLTPGGMIVVEPWLEPGVIEPGRVFAHTGEAAGVRVTRESRAEVEGRLSRLFFDYEITGAAGTRRVSEVHELGLFTPEELDRAFRNAGLVPEYDPKGLTDRGLYVSRVQ